MTHPIDIQTLRLFLKVAELGNISRAADALGLSQPSVSRTLKVLEQSLHVALFHRTGRGVTLTAAGELAVAHARTVVDGCDGFVQKVREFAHGPSGVVSLALLTAYMRAFAADLFDEVRRRYPGIMLRMVESFSAQHEDWLQSGQVDIALITRYRTPDIGSDDVVASSPLVLVGKAPLPPGASCAGQDALATLRFRDLRDVPLVLPASPNGLRMRMEEEARQQGIDLRIVFEADSLEAQLALIRRARCYALLSEHTVRQEGYMQAFQACRIVEPTLPRHVVLRTTPHHPLSQAAREVAHLLRRMISQSHAWEAEPPPPAAATGCSL